MVSNAQDIAVFAPLAPCPPVSPQFWGDWGETLQVPQIWGASPVLVVSGKEELAWI
jgi:hypothetical protein